MPLAWGPAMATVGTGAIGATMMPALGVKGMTARHSTIAPVVQVRVPEDAAGGRWRIPVAILVIPEKAHVDAILAKVLA